MTWETDSRPRPVTLEEQRDRGLIREAPGTFVPPAPVTRPRAEIVAAPEWGPVAEMDAGTPSAVLVEQYKTSHVDRAKAFSIRTWQLSLVTLIVLTMALWLIGAAFIPALLVGLLAYLGVWLFAFLVDARNSPGGVARYHATQQWREIRRMNQARVDAFRKANGLDKQGRGRR